MKEEWTRALDTAARAGVAEHEFITPSGRQDRLDGLEGLARYVAVTEHGDTHAPFVRQVTVFHANAALEGVDVVDTPGLEDPSPIRKDITTRWIHQAAAVVYVLYAGRLLDDADVRFIDGYLLGIPSRFRLLAVNKIDVSDSLGGLQAYVEGLRKSADPRLKAVLGSKDGTAWVCALGALLASMRAKALPLDVALRDAQSNLSSRGDWLSPNRHGVDDLWRLVQERLLSNRGEAIIAEHEAFLRGILVYHGRACSRDASDLRARRANLVAEKDELQRRREALRRLVARLTRDAAQLRRSIEDARKDITSSLRSDFTARRTAIGRAFEAELATVHDIAVFERKAPWILQRLVDGELHGVGKALHDAETQIVAALEDKVSDFEEKLMREAGVLREIVETRVDLELSAARNAAHAGFSVLSRQDVAALVEDCTWFWERWFNTDAGMRRVVASLRGAVDEAVRDGFQDLWDKVEDATTVALQGLAASIESSLQAGLAQQQEEIEELLKSEVDRKRALREVEAHEAGVAGRLRTVTETAIAHGLDIGPLCGLHDATRQRDTSGCDHGRHFGCWSHPGRPGGGSPRTPQRETIRDRMHAVGGERRTPRRAHATSVRVRSAHAGPELRVGAIEREWTLAQIAEREGVHGQCLGRPVLDLSSLYERQGVSLKECRGIIEEYVAREWLSRPDGATTSELVGGPVAERAAKDASAMLVDDRWLRPFHASHRGADG